MATITADQVPWDQLKAWGIHRSQLESSKENMERLLCGRFTTPQSFYRSDGDMHMEGSAAIRVYMGKDGAKVELQGIGPKIAENSRLYLFGVELSKEQVRGLLDTGHAGSPVQSKDGSRQYLVSLNRDTNRLVSYPMEAMVGPKDGMVAGVRLTDEQKEKYCRGEAVFLEGLTRGDGTKFDACAQFSAWTRKNEFTHPEWLRKAQEEKKTREKEQAMKASPETEQSKSKGRKR